MVLDLDALSKLEAEATPGPWKEFWDHKKVRVVPESSIFPIFEDDQESDGKRMRDAALIAAARNSLPALIAEVKAAREWLAKEDALDESAKGATTPYCGEDEFVVAQAAREAYRAIVEVNSK